MPKLLNSDITAAVLHLLDAQKFPERDQFTQLLVGADDALERRTAQARRLRHRLGKLLDLLPEPELRCGDMDGRDCCDE